MSGPGFYQRDEENIDAGRTEAERRVLRGEGQAGCALCEDAAQRLGVHLPKKSGTPPSPKDDAPQSREAANSGAHRRDTPGIG